MPLSIISNIGWPLDLVQPNMIVLPIHIQYSYNPIRIWGGTGMSLSVMLSSHQPNPNGLWWFCLWKTMFSNNVVVLQKSCEAMINISPGADSDN